MFLAGVNVLWGTYLFVYNLIYLRDKVGMSGGFVALQTLSAIVHALLYVMILIVFAAESDKYFQHHPKESIESQTDWKEETGKRLDCIFFYYIVILCAIVNCIFHRTIMDNVMIMWYMFLLSNAPKVAIIALLHVLCLCFVSFI